MAWYNTWSGVFPSVKDLARIGLDKCWRDQIIAHLKESPTELKWVLYRANECMNGNGVETLRGSRRFADYVSRGDTYATTLMLVPSTGRFHVGAWGDWVEAEERRGNKFD